MFVLLQLSISFFSVLLLWHGSPSAGFPLFGTNTGCGGKLTGANGTIKTPRYPQKYPKNTACIWIISGNDFNSTVEVTFESFMLENHPHCRYDYVIIRDGDSELAPIIGKFCGNNVPRTINSAGNSLWLRFYSDSVNNDFGFKAFYRRSKQQPRPTKKVPKNSVDLCSGSFFGKSGEITSPDFPKQYPNNLNCIWTIENNDDTSVTEVSFEAFKLEYTPSCLFDFVTIEDLFARNRQPITRLCGGALPPKYIGKKIRIVFQSDDSGVASGFKIKWRKKELEGKKVCGFTKSSAIGFLRSSNYPENYDNNEHCEWKISAPAESMKVQLRFSDFDLERDSKCSYDYLAVFDGDNKASPLLEKFCGSTVPRAINSTQQNMRIVFKSDHSDTRSGFQALWVALDNPRQRGRALDLKKNKIARSPTANCGGLLTAINGSIATPNYPNGYPSDTACIWVIKADNKHYVKLSFKSLDIEKHSACEYDNIEVRDGADVTSKLLGRFCGSRTPKDITSTGKSLWIQFKSDKSVEKPGILATWNFIMRSGNVACGTKFRDDSGELSPPGYPQVSGSKKYCSWNIEVSKGKKIKLIFKEIRLKPSAGCALSYVQISDGESDRYPDLGRFCRPMLPRTIISSTNKLFIGFQPDGAADAQGFVLEWESVENEDNSNTVTSFPEIACGSTLTAETGDIILPSGVKSCTWLIRPASGRRIALSVIKANMIPNPECNVERIFIQNGLTPLAPALARICGQYHTKHVISSSGALRVQYDLFGQSNGQNVHLYWTTVTHSLNTEFEEASCEKSWFSNPEDRINAVTSIQSRVPPWVAGLLLGPGMVSCGATILSTKWLLTAAHCLKRYPWYFFGKIRLGALDSSPTNDKTEQSLGIKMVYIHPSYNSVTNQDDIALINIKGQIALNENVNPVCLPKNDTVFEPNTKCITSGWGTRRFLGEPSKTLVHATVPLVSKTECNMTGPYKGKIGEDMLCAGDKLGRNDTCQGDGGGPLTCEVLPGRHVLVGISSWGSGCGFPERYGVYTEVRKYLNWISSTIERM